MTFFFPDVPKWIKLWLDFDPQTVQHVKNIENMHHSAQRQSNTMCSVWKLSNAAEITGHGEKTRQEDGE